MRCCTSCYVGFTCLLSALLSLPSRVLADDGASSIKSDEQVLFFPTAAQWDSSTRTWRVPIRGWIFEPETDSISRRIAVSRMQSALGLSPGEPASRLFAQRASWFLVDNERDKSIAITIAGQTLVLPPSNADGHFTGQAILSDEQAKQHARDGRLMFAAVTETDDRRSFTGMVHLCPPEGVSVVSDIDDTIKITEVRDRRRLLKRTFLEPFEAVPGMATLYRRWAEADTQFHYVSAGPWHLYEPLSTFMRQQRFPEGTFHLKRFRVKDVSVKNLFQDPIAYKQAVIENLMRAFPKRRFVFVGDSGEKDPEVYGILARKYPDQVMRILIRDVTQQERDDARYQSALHGVPGERWKLFRDGGTLDRNVLSDD